MTFTNQFEIWPNSCWHTLTRGQGQVIHQWGCGVWSCCIPNDVPWPGEQFGTTYKSLAPSCRDLLTKKRFMASHDLRWTFQVPLSISGTRIITDEIIFHNTERIGWFCLVYTTQEAFQYFPIGWQRKGHESGLTSDHRYENSEIYNLHILVS